MSAFERVPIQAYIDVSPCSRSAAASAIAWLQRIDALGGIVERASVAGSEALELPPGWERSASAARACERAIVSAARDAAHLLVVFEGARPSTDAIGGLAQILASDPQVGLVHPRFADMGGQRIAASILVDEASSASVSRDVLATLPALEIATERVSPCFLIRRELVARLTPDVDEQADGKRLLAECVLRARALGFQTIESNRTVVRLDRDACQDSFVTRLLQRLRA
jgi:hypothetical protein